MIANVGFSTPHIRDQLWDKLDLIAKHRQIELNEVTHLDSLYFTHEASKSKVLTLISLNPELKDCDFNLNDFSEHSLELLLCWHMERLMLESLRIHRHTLGNLIVIFLSKMMRLEGKISQEENQGLEKLHGRFSELYSEFEKINASKARLPKS